MEKKQKKVVFKPLSKEKMEERRKVASQYFRANKKVTWIASELGVSRIAVQQWKKKWREDGIAGLASAKCGRASKLTKHQETLLKKDIMKGAKRFGSQSDRWTLKKITSHVKKKIRVEYSERSLWHVLKRSGFVCDAPELPVIVKKEKPKRTWVYKNTKIQK